MVDLILINIPKNPMWTSMDGLSHNGGHFTIYVEKGHDSRDVMTAKQMLHNQHDVVSIKTEPYLKYKKMILHSAMKIIGNFEKHHNIKL